MLTLRAFGALDLRDAEGAPLGTVLAQTKRVALLAYLLLSRPGELHRRDSLLALFWPETDQEHGRKALSQALSFLRREVGEEVVLTRGGEEVGVDPELVRCDVLAFQEALGQEDWAGALELYRGDLLEGLHVKGAPEFVGWVDRERVGLREAAAGAAWRLAHQLIVQGKPVEAERTAQRALGLVATDESPVRAFIEALTQGGDRGAALRFYEKFRGILERELGVEPAPETEALVRAVREGELRARVLDGVVAEVEGMKAEPEEEGMGARAQAVRPPADPHFNPREGRPRRGRAKAAVYAGAAILGLGAVAVTLARRSSEPAHVSILLVDPRPGIAVLPCENLSPAPEDACYAEGIHDAITTRLRMVSSILPTGRTSVLGYRDRPAPPEQMARELGVEYLGECGVLKEGDRIRVTFRLLEAESGRQIWAEPFEAMLAEAGGLISLQSEIARRIVEGIGERLTPEEETRITARPTDNLEAYELYLMGRSRFLQGSPERYREAIRHFEAAIGLDPSFALAYAGLGDALLTLLFTDLSVKPSDVMDQARAAVSRAYELDPTAGEVHIALGSFLSLLQWDWVAAEHHFLEGLRLKPGDVLARLYFASLLSIVGRFEEGALETRLVLAMDPRSSTSLWSSGNRMWQAGRVEEARNLFERAIRIEPVTVTAFSHLAFSYAWDEPKNLTRAAELLSEFARRFGYASPERMGSVIEAIGGDSSLRREALAVLDHFVASTLLDRPHLIYEYAALAPEDTLFELMEEAYLTRHVWTPWIPISVGAVRPEIQDDPRWARFLAQIGHPGLEKF